MAEPLHGQAGDTWTWTRSEISYPATEWVLKYYLSKDAAEPVVVTAVADGLGFKVTVDATSSAGYQPGDYHWTARVSKNGEVHTVGKGVLTVQPDPSAASDPRTLAERMVAILSAALEAAAPGALIVEYEVDGFKTKKDRYSILKELAIWQAKVRRERGAPIARLVPVGMTRV